MNEPKRHHSTHCDWRDGFNWEERKPSGRSLKNRGVMKLQQEGRPWFKLHYREEYVDLTPYSEALARRTLVLVEEFRGRELVRSETMEIELPVARPATDVAPDDPDSF